MSDEELKESPKVTLLDELKQELQKFVNQRDQAQVNLQQLIGAIYACEIMIKKHEDEAVKKLIDESLADDEIEDDCDNATTCDSEEHQ